MNKRKIILSILIIIALLLVVFGLKSVILRIIYQKDYSEYVYKYSEENDIDPLLTYAIIKAESNFKQNVESKSGAIGLMQLMPDTAKEIAENLGEELTIEELYDAEKNIMIGTKYYSTLIKKYDGHIELALAAYNAGIGNVDNWINDGILKEDGSNVEDIPYKETNMYVRKILRDYEIYQNLYKE